MKINKLASSKNNTVKTNLLKALQDYLLEDDISDHEMGEVIDEMIHFGDMSHIVYESAGDGESVPHCNPLQLIQKIMDFQDDYPQHENGRRLFNKLHHDLYADNNRNHYIGGNQLFLDVAQQSHDADLVEQKQSRHPTIELYSQLAMLTASLRSDPENMDELWLFWHENQSMFNPAEISSKDFFVAPVSTTDYETKRLATYDAERVAHMHKQHADNYRCHAAKDLFCHFVEHPHLQQTLTQHFPAFFQFARWLPDAEVKKYHHYFTSEHLDILTQYKSEPGYVEYLEVLMSTKTINEPRSIKMFTKMAATQVMWDNLFNDLPIIFNRNTFKNFLGVEALRLNNAEASQHVKNIITVWDHNRLQQILPEKTVNEPPPKKMKI